MSPRPLTLPAHGTRYRYNAFKCRCPLCRADNARYERERRADGRDARRSVVVTDSGRRLPAVQFALPFHRTDPPW